MANAPISVIFGSQWPRASHTHRESMENMRILFTRPLKLKQCDFLGGFQLPSKFNMGFICTHLCEPNVDEIFFWPMSPHEELNCLCGTLVAFFDLKHFLVEKSVRKSIYFLTWNTQYPLSSFWGTIFEGINLTQQSHRQFQLKARFLSIS